MRWEVIFQPQNLALYAEGLTTTLWLLATSLLAGGVLAVLCALLLTSTSRALMPLRWLTSTYTYCLRGTPLLIQVYLIYYGLGRVNTNSDRVVCAGQYPAWRSRPHNSPPLSTACPSSVATSA